MVSNFEFELRPYYCNRRKTVSATRSAASARDVLLNMNPTPFILQALFPIPLPMVPVPQSLIALVNR
jgi:hypothetical protein